MLTIQNIHKLYKQDITNVWRIAKVRTEHNCYYIEIMRADGYRGHIVFNRIPRPYGRYSIIYDDTKEVITDGSEINTMNGFIDVLKYLFK